MPNSYEHSYQHDLDNVIDASDAVLAIGTDKVYTNTLKDRSLTGNDATIHGAMPSSGYFFGRRFVAANENYLNCGNGSLDITEHINFTIAVHLDSTMIGVQCDLAGNHKYNVGGWFIRKLTNEKIQVFWYRSGAVDSFASTEVLLDNCINIVTFSYNEIAVKLTINGVTKILDKTTDIASTPNDLHIGKSSGVATFNSNFNLLYFILNDLDDTVDTIPFNTLARLPLYSHNFTQYPNSDTSLTSVFPYTSGIITSGSFNKTDGLKCTSAGTIVFSNNFEFDGSEYLTLTIDDVEYSGTTTVTQGTITATISQGSNDITIEMGTNDVLEDIQIQFRSEV